MAATPLSNKVHIGRVIRNAVVFNPRNWDSLAVTADRLIQTVARLFKLLQSRNVDYLLVGGVALLHYVEGRNTEDLDLIMALPAFAQVPELNLQVRDADFASGSFDDLRIDILLTRNPLFHHVQQNYATTLSFAEQSIPGATVEGLLLLKLYALPSLYRQGNFARVSIYENDVAMLIQAFQPSIESLLTVLRDHLSDTDLKSVRDVVAEIQERIDRFGRSRRSSD